MPQYDAEEDKVATIVRALAEEGYDEALVLNSDDFRTVWTERREELADKIRASDDLSVSELAEDLGREQPAISRDLDVLYKYNVVGFERDGRRKIPYVKYDTILHEPIF